MDFAKAFATSLLLTIILPSIFRVGVGSDFALPSILRTLSHTHGKGVLVLMVETHRRQHPILASFTTRLDLARAFLKRIKVASLGRRFSRLSAAFLALIADWHSSDHQGTGGRRYCPVLLGIELTAAR